MARNNTNTKFQEQYDAQIQKEIDDAHKHQADTLKDDEIAAIREWKAKYEAAQEQERRASRSLEQRYLDAFEDATENEAAPSIDPMAVIAHIAALFHDDDPSLRQEGTNDNLSRFAVQPSEPNVAAYNQKGILGGLCNQAHYIWQREKRREEWTEKKAEQAKRAYIGGEIDTLELRENQTAWHRSTKVNLPLIEEWLKCCKAAYLAQYGEEWTPPQKRNEDPALKIELKEAAEVHKRRSML